MPTQSSPTGYFAPCDHCHGLGRIFVCNTREDELEDICQECSGAKSVWVRTAAPDTQPPPAAHSTIPCAAPSFEAHDDFEPGEWRNRLEAIADVHKLTMPTV